MFAANPLALLSRTPGGPQSTSSVGFAGDDRTQRWPRGNPQIQRRDGSAGDQPGRRNPVTHVTLAARDRTLVCVKQRTRPPIGGHHVRSP
jgi:hypothetical protein